MVGTKWFKCDLHLHTPASKCFRDRSVTAQQWVQEAIDKGLNCVAITDHNTGEWIDDIKTAAQGTSLVVFPGVEITCSDAKVHLLVLFDPEKTRQEVEDFIIQTEIERSKFGEQDAHSPLGVEEVVDLAIEKGAIVIPAHIDEYNGICQVANVQRNNLLKSDKVLGVQVVHQCLTVAESEYNAQAKREALKTINNYFGVSDEDVAANQLKVNEDRLKDWRQAVVQSIKNNKAILTFSDNPHAQGDSRHGLWGMGQRYSWIKMDQAPSLESLRQALLLHKFRIKSDFDCPNNQKPYDTPDVWLQKITIKNTEISHITNSLEVHFSPQMTTIIGGRGSGKSAILQFLRGLFKKGDELQSLELVHSEFTRFFKFKGRDKFGVLKPLTEIEAEVIRLDEPYKIKMVQVNQSTKEFTIEKFNTTTSQFERVDENYLAFFDFDIFSQKQIYEVATNLNSLRERIDETDENIVKLKDDIGLKAQELKQKGSEIRTLQLRVQNKAFLQAEIDDIESRIQKYHASGIDQELKKRQDFQKDESVLNSFKDTIKEKASEFDVIANSIAAPQIDIDELNSVYQEEIADAIQEANSKVQEAKDALLSLKEQYLQIPTTLQEAINQTQWKTDNEKSVTDFEQKKTELSEAGVGAVEQVQSDADLLERKKSDLRRLEQVEREIEQKQAEKANKKQEYTGLRLRLTELRKSFLDNLLQGTNVRAKVEGCRDMNNMFEQIKTIVAANPGTYVDDIQKLTEYWNPSNPQRSNEGIFKTIIEIVNDEYTGGDFYRPFMTKVKGLNGEQIDDFDLLFPEDQIKIEYKTAAGNWKQLSNASAGQKTAAILTMILCQGKKPLILDQPEDDLDNNLIYDLVVEQLRKTKECRQIICVTHNANIPVNGDSEHIVVMDSETKHIQMKLSGCIEVEEIKKAICDIMEGGTEAFEMRFKRYQRIRN